METPQELVRVLRYCHEPEVREKALKRLEEMAECLDETGRMELLRLSQQREALEIAIRKSENIPALIHRLRINMQSIEQWNSQVSFWGNCEESSIRISELEDINRSIIQRLGSFVSRDSWEDASRAIFIVIDYSDDAQHLAKALGRMLSFLSGEESPREGRRQLKSKDETQKIISAKAASIIRAIEKVRGWDAFEGMVLFNKLNCIMSGCQARTAGLESVTAYLEETARSLVSA